jgi:hypothetical protein
LRGDVGDVLTFDKSGLPLPKKPQSLLPKRTVQPEDAVEYTAFERQLLSWGLKLSNVKPRCSNVSARAVKSNRNRIVFPYQIEVFTRIESNQMQMESNEIFDF